MVTAGYGASLAVRRRDNPDAGSGNGFPSLLVRKVWKAAETPVCSSFWSASAIRIKGQKEHRRSLRQIFKKVLAILSALVYNSWWRHKLAGDRRVLEHSTTPYEQPHYSARQTAPRLS